MNIDLICCHPFHLDYPLWREFIKNNRDRFNKVIVVFTDMNVADLDYREFVQTTMKKDKITFMDCLPAEANEDWRNKAINMALTVSNAEWIWFMEEDFFPQNNFWKEVEDLMKRCDVFGYYQDARLHPCCIFIKRELLDKTSKNFGVIRDEADHFSRIQKNLESKDIMIGVIPSYLGKHMNALSQNMFMLQNGEEPNYQPEEFKEYCKQCLLLEDLHTDFLKLFREYVK